MGKKISLSIVSHGHQVHIVSLLRQLASLGRQDLEVILTLNVPEVLPMVLDSLPFKVYLIVNPCPRGFSVNHNAAFLISCGDYFVVLNPDVCLLDDPFPALLAMQETNTHSICAPLIIGHNGEVEDSARNFPSPYLLLKKLLCRLLKRRLRPEVVAQNESQLMPDWAAGMFLLVPRDIYQILGGFDERYFLYYEDVDLCARAQLAGCKVLVSKQARVIHQAQRDSHRKFRFLVWHLKSAARFFISGVYLQICLRRVFPVKQDR